ncbi:hypothetical protein LSH36_1446g00003 [Paralvinella palmiformis]|uniref:Uncharacterized protein n=1 Tax=Paralvinella palmiformis TaxID=53620 RepID=A0AAD9ITA6_9ANNE|nr:hypothetical protein LSH36_1446g00003 [Paralvinella palmiformis]
MTSQPTLLSASGLLDLTLNRIRISLLSTRGKRNLFIPASEKRPEVTRIQTGNTCGRIAFVWTCFNRGCISKTELCDLSNSCGDWSDVTCTPNVPWVGSYRPSPYGCDLDHGNECGFLGLANPSWVLDHESVISNPDPYRMPSSIQNQFCVRAVFGDVIDDVDRLGLTDTRVTLVPNQTYCLSFW